MCRNQPELASSPGSSASSSGTQRQRNPGSALEASSTSNGLSSTKTMLSTPMLSSAAIDAMFSDLVSQLIRRVVMSPSVSTMPSCRSKTSTTSNSLFLLTIASITPRRLDDLQLTLKRLEGAAREGITELQAADPVFADGAAPKRVVAIEHETLGRRLEAARRDAADFGTDEEPEVALVRLAVHRPFLGGKDRRLARVTL